MEYEVQNGLAVNDLKRDFWGISSHINVGANGKIFLFWGHAADGKGSASDGSRVGGLAKGDNTSSDQWEVSYAYDLSRRTKVYVGYVKINNDSNATYTFNINPYPVGAGGNPGGFVMGMGHNF
jgi:hypothetical protein